MNLKGIERFVKVRPFRPFTVRESSGVSHRILSLESIKVLPNLGIVVIYTPDGDLAMLGADQITAASYTTKKKQA